jgi:transposase InsO family protein
VTFGFIAAEKAEYPVTVLCQCLGVTRSGYYAWARRGPAARTVADAQLTRQLCVAHADSRGTYGRPRLYRALRARGIAVSAKRVARLMRAAGLVARGRRRFRVTTDSTHHRPVVPNRLARGFAVPTLNTVWAGDLTACWTAAGWSYLAVILDLASRRVVGWAVARTLTTAVVTAALRMALTRRRPRAPVLHHSDRGTQYASRAYRRLLAAHGLTASMSRKGNCWDNAPVESFFSSLKAELLPPRPWPDHATARHAIGDYIETFYNPRRLHSTLGYRSPVDFETSLKTAV